MSSTPLVKVNVLDPLLAGAPLRCLRSMVSSMTQSEGGGICPLCTVILKSTEDRCDYSLEEESLGYLIKGHDSGF
jgi:hypothetical protein